MTATATHTIEHLDFQQALPCEAETHPHDGPDLPAAWAIDTRCPACRGTGHYLICDTWMRDMVTAETLDCSACGHISDNYRDFITNIRSIT